MPKWIIKGVGMMQRETLQYDASEPGALEALLKALDRAGDALHRENAARCRAILGTVGLADMMDGTGAVDTGKLREKGLAEDSAQWLAALWLGAFGRLKAERERLRTGRSTENTLNLIIEHAQEMGRLQERMWWRAGVDPQTGKKREALALSGRRQVKGGRDGNAMKGAKSFAATHGAAAQARADALHSENPRRTWARIREIIASEYRVSPETIKKALRNPKKTAS